MEKEQFDTDARPPVRPPLKNDERVRIFQRKLYLKAKQAKGFIAHTLYDKICDYRLLCEAYARVKSGKDAQSSPGVDGQSIAWIEEQGREEFFLLLQSELQCKGYRAQAVKRVFIPKANSKDLRPLGIPTIRDRVVHMAVKMVIEPLPKRNAQQAIKAIRDNIHAGYKFCI